MSTRTAVDAEDRGGPIAELSALTHTRRELNRAEDALVRRARAQGHSWQAIASALGVSKQAAHRRYGRR